MQLLMVHSCSTIGQRTHYHLPITSNAPQEPITNLVHPQCQHQEPKHLRGGANNRSFQLRHRPVLEVEPHLGHHGHMVTNLIFGHMRTPQLHTSQFITIIQPVTEIARQMVCTVLQPLPHSSSHEQRRLIYLQLRRLQIFWLPKRSHFQVPH